MKNNSGSYTYHRLCLLILLLAAFGKAGAQAESSYWAFGNYAGIDFSTGTPLAVRTAMDNQFGGNASVSSGSGTLLFYTDGNRIWNRNHTLMTGAPLLTSSYGSSSAGTWAVNQPVVVVPVPGDSNLYYLFSLEIFTGGYRLWYSVVDMRLDNGLGAVAQPPVLHDPGPLTEAMTIVRGESCNYWLLVHEKFTDQFRAYEINAAGIGMTPVRSHAGTLGAAIFSFSNYHLGGIKISPDRRKIAGNWAHSGLSDYYLEMYDFDPMTGMVSGGIRLDGPRMYHYNSCFSPDNSKLYSTGNGYLHQFDLSQPTPAAIAASKTDLFPGRFIVTHGDLRRGPDQRIYLILRGTGTVHRINSPDLPGIACDVVRNAFPLAPGTDANWGLPNEQLQALPHESVRTGLHHAQLCGTDSLLLAGNTAGINHIWQDGSRSASVKAGAPGQYSVRYSSGCVHYHDTFLVHPRPVFPALHHNGFSCTDESTGIAYTLPHTGDTNLYNYHWQDAQGRTLRQTYGVMQDSIGGLPPGNYRLRAETMWRCDTVFSFRISPLPAPEAAFSVSDSICMQSPFNLTNRSSGAHTFEWDFGDGTKSTDKEPAHSYAAAGNYQIGLRAVTAEGCSDLYSLEVTAGNHRFLSLSADKAYADQGVQISLQTSAGQPYWVSSWLPAALFADQHAYQHHIVLDTSRTFTAIAESSSGCTDSASVRVEMNPVIFIPDAFTPNGDGHNDYFRPVYRGSRPSMENLMIYNRWGELVWSADAHSLRQGWDGTQAGAPAPPGTYFYYFRAGLPAGTQLYRKGSVSLIR